MNRIQALLAAGLILAAPMFQTRQMSSEIYNMQQRLRDLGYYNIKATGVYAGLTQGVIKRFQQNNNFDITGDITADEFETLHSPRAVSQYTIKAPVVSTSLPLENQSWEEISESLPTNFSFVNPVDNKQYQFTRINNNGHTTGTINTKDFPVHLRMPVVVVINGKNYPASLETDSNSAELYFKGSTNSEGRVDAEHEFNIERLLGK